MMKAVQILGHISSPRITTNYSMPKPTPISSEILIHVHAAGITGDEIIWPEPYQTPSRIPGHDISGTIAALGPDYDGSLKVGQEVFALIAADRGEGQADYVVCSAEEVAPKPVSLSHAEAAALPIPVLTAYEAIVDHVKITSDAKTLVTGASGAVGLQFVQLVKRLTSAHVVALASPRHHDALRRLGADEVIDYATSSWEKSIENVDVVFDTVGGEVLARTWEVVKDDGVIVTVGDPAPAWAFGRGEAPEASTYPGVKYTHFIVSPNAKRLEEVAKMFDEGLMKPLAVRAFDFDQAEQAWEYAQQRGRGYKAIIEF
ncbi:hypothetical protein NW762_013870 [Fusarium torreyae]|uniref:Enoyl reductase (ER) domain-containing protein n=1 Tax=Fusarium torreyae TaxID=1237075 RepID=A0A9W8RJR8_9HYPO|nr:hypothetical protein NW762_013870 [Fusarium torreyae]